MLVIESENAETNGLTFIQRDSGQSVGRGVRHEVEVRSPTSNDDSETHDRVSTHPKRRLGSERKFERPRDANQSVCRAGGVENPKGASDETVGDFVVPRAGNHGHGHTAPVDDDLG